MKQFICIYCGKKKEYRNRSKEHVIPNYLFGKFIIHEVCKDCNEKIGSNIEKYFPDYIKSIKFLKNGILRMPGIAFLKNGQEIKGMCEVVEQRTSRGPYKRRIFTGNETYSESDIAYMILQPIGPGDTQEIKKVIAKIGFASIHYLLNYKLTPRRQYLEFVNCSELQSLRLMFNENAITWPNIESCRFRIESKNRDELNGILADLPNPQVRRNIISISNEDNNINIEIILLSQFLWRITIYDMSSPINNISEESQLSELSPI